LSSTGAISWNGLELCEARLERGLALVRFEHLARGQRVVVGEQRVHAVARLLGGDGLRVELPLEAEAIAGLAPVAGVRARAAAAGLPKAMRGLRI
jgi:hypothetical protein